MISNPIYNFLNLPISSFYFPEEIFIISQFKKYWKEYVNEKKKRKSFRYFFPFFLGKRRKRPCIILRSELKIPSCDFHRGQTTVLAVNDPWAVTPLQFRRVPYLLWFVLEKVGSQVGQVDTSTRIISRVDNFGPIGHSSFFLR